MLQAIFNNLFQGNISSLSKSFRKIMAAPLSVAVRRRRCMVLVKSRLNLETGRQLRLQLC